MADELSVLRDLQTHVQNVKLASQRLSALALQGDDQLIHDFLTESVKIDGQGPTSKDAQLYVACFWGLKEIVERLLQMGVDCNQQNKDSKWTPLHAATFQEHGPVVMMLLENGAKPEIPDSEGRTPHDFASISDQIWPHFASLGLTRTSRIQLLEKRVLKRGLSGNQRMSDFNNTSIKMASYSRPDSAYEVNSDPFVAAAATGDVLADVNDAGLTFSDSQPQFSVWR